MKSQQLPKTTDYPAFIKAFRERRLQKAAENAYSLLSSCSICPRKCGVNRLKGEEGVCKTGKHARVHSFMPHHGEEPPISGERGSGTIFFACCNMKCQYCQNFEFSQEGEGSKEVTPDELGSIMLSLQKEGCHNINFVTPTHVMPQILQALCLAIPQGLKIPLVYNTSGYELPEIISMLDGIIDIYLPDMRYADEESARRYSMSSDYPHYNQQAVKEMHRQTGVADISSDGIIKKGVIIRHLVLPNGISGTEKIMKFIKEELSDETYISLMSQYTPYYHAHSFRELNRRITMEEYQQAKEAMEKYGLYNGWVQESFGLERFAGVNIKPTFKKDGNDTSKPA